MLTLYRNNPLLFFAATVGSLLLSIWCVYANPIINNDGILYVTIANEFLHGQWQQGLELYRWPFYPFLIAITAKLLPVSTEYTAHVLNAIFAALLCLGFICTTRELGANKRILIFATILVLCFPSINKYRSYITRDMGYLACYIWSLYYLIRYTNTRDTINLIGWTVCTVLCILFRIEAIALLCIIPLLFWFIKLKKLQHRLLLAVIIAIVSILLSTGLTMWLFSAETNIFSQQIMEQPITVIKEIWFHLVQQVNFRLLAIEQEFLGEFSRDYAKTVLLITLLVMVSYETLRRLIFIYAIMAWHALKHKLVLNNPLHYKLWLAFVFIHFAILCAFTFGKMFVVSRYTMALVLTILLLVPFSADYFWQQWRSKQNSTVKWLMPLFIIVFCLSSLKGLDRWSEHYHLKQAGHWAIQNIEPNTRIYSNQRAFLFYANRESIRTNVNHSWSETMRLARSKTLDQNYDYMVISFPASRPDQAQRFEALFPYPPIKTFKNERDNTLAIYKLQKNSLE